jgi:hypothetical protein
VGLSLMIGPFEAQNVSRLYFVRYRLRKVIEISARFSQHTIAVLRGKSQIVFMAQNIVFLLV